MGEGLSQVMGVMHDSNRGNLMHKESRDAFHYQVEIADCLIDKPGKWVRDCEIDLDEHLRWALEEHYECKYVACTGMDPSWTHQDLAIYQLEFLIELQNSEGAASFDNFYLRYR